MKELLFNVWWVVMAADGFIAFVLALGFWRGWRRARRRGAEDYVSFWTAVMLACFSLEALVRAGTVYHSADPDCLATGGLWLSVAARTVKAAGMWVWWLRAFNGRNGHEAAPPRNPAGGGGR